jgi:LPXTG-motif cell wall-anchored protein
MTDDSSNTGTALAPSLLRLIDPDTGNPVTSVTVTEGVYTANSDGTITFDPNPNYAGTATPVTYQVTDSLGQSDTATYTPTVNPPPAPTNSTSSGGLNQIQIHRVILNEGEYLMLWDPAANGGVGAFSKSVVKLANGTYEIVPGGIKFTPNLDFTGIAEPVTYQVTDSMGYSATATHTPAVSRPAGPPAVDPLTVKNAVATYLIEKLPKTGAGNFSFALSLMFVLALIGTGLLIHAKRSQRIRLDLD